ncbi:uncharacterized protein LOC125384479 [Haliotis rufescens]|uniref:uncharacterized protein LOC125384479 n=1 Tax=Haliotis rufescens TaxID=6454 RepID=UPI00201F1E3F|nr:uncharacterized protein LOC125384479 [Haliotis rufescens]
MTQTECRDFCLTYHAEEKECAAFSHDKRTDTCLLLQQTCIYISDSPTTSSDRNSITAVKKCYDFHTSDEPLRYSDNVKQLNSICTTLNSQNECMDAQGAPDASSSSHVGLASSLAPTQSSDWRLLSPSLSDVNEVASVVAVDTKTTSGLHTRSIKSPETSPSELQPSLPILHQTDTAGPALPSPTQIQDSASTLHYDGSAGPALPSQTQVQDSATTLHYDASAGPALPSQTQIQDSASTSHRDETADVLQTQVPDMTRTCLCRCSAFHIANNAQAPAINQSKLRVDRHNLSSYRRRLTSAVDDRPSARVVGSVLGVALLVTVGVVIVLMDVTAVLKTLLTHKTPPVKTLIAVREIRT